MEASVDKRWFCGSCNVEWKKQSGDVWIQCDRCDVPFHFQCAGFDYDPKDYYELNTFSSQGTGTEVTSYQLYSKTMVIFH